jgi:hypothetical protein
VTKARALRWLTVAGWIVLAIPPVLYAVMTLVLSFGGAGLDGMGIVTAVVMLAAVSAGAFKFLRGEVREGWLLLALAWAPLVLTVLWGWLGAPG